MGVSSTGMKIDHGRLGWIGKKESQKNDKNDKCSRTCI